MIATAPPPQPPAPPAVACRPGPAVAYLVNQYPKVSHSFIRREIAALESQGVRVMRCSIRPVREPLVDPADRAEVERTRVVLEGGAAALVGAVLRTAAARPAALLRGLAMAMRLARAAGSVRVGLLRHVAYLVEACVLERWLREAGVRHLHAHFGTNSAAVALLTHVVSGATCDNDGIRYSFTVHGPEEFDRPAALSLGEKIRHAAFVVAISSFGRSQLYRWCEHGQWAKVHVVHCGLDGAFLKQADAADQPGPSSLRSTDPAFERRFVCVGRLCEQKGQLLLVEAAARLADEGHDFSLVLVGDGEMRGEIDAMVRGAGLGGRVTVTGWASGERVREELSRCRAMLLPSFAEGLPVAIMEAMALGRPVITTSIAGVPELVTPECGWVVPAGSVDALTAAMRACLEASPQTLERMGEAGAARVRERHDIRVEAAKLAALLSGVAPPVSAELPCAIGGAA